MVDIKVKDQLESFFSNYDSHNQTEDLKLNEIENKFDSKSEKNISSLDQNFNNSICTHINDYEELLRKHECDIRNHIKIQHQYRIYSENLKTKIEELEKSRAENKKTIANLQEV